jgi:hypothetical protein
MPKAQPQGKTTECIGRVCPTAQLGLARHGEGFPSKTSWHYTGERGANLRQILQQYGIDLYNNGAKVVNYRRISSCSFCAVPVEGKVSIAKLARKARRSLPLYSSAFFGKQGCI